MSFLRRMLNWLSQGPTPMSVVAPVTSAPDDYAIAAERQKIIETASAMPLLDGVFTVLLYDRHRRLKGRPTSSRKIRST